MTRDAREHQPETVAPARGTRFDYTSAVYGSLLAASVVVGAGTPGTYTRLQLVLLLLCTGLVFWAAHVFARLSGVWVAQRPLTRLEIRRVCADEWPITTAAVPPAIAAAISPLLGLGASGTAWLALGVAVAGQVGWATFAAVRAGAPPLLVVTSGTANLLLGVVIVLVKVALQH